MVVPVMVKPRSVPEPAPWHAGFLAMLPKIVTCARVAFRAYAAEAKEDAVQQVVANALVAYVRLAELDKLAAAFPTVLARFAIAQVRDGRMVGTQANVKDVLSYYARRRKGFIVQRLDVFDETEGEWREAVVEDCQTPVPDQVAFRIDFPEWLSRLSRRDRRMVERLAVGSSTGEVAQRFRLTAGRISQKRYEFYCSWLAFHGEPVHAS